MRKLAFRKRAPRGLTKVLVTGVGQMSVAALDGPESFSVHWRSMFKPGDKVVVFQHDGKEFRGVVVLTEVLTSGNKVRVKSGDFILNVDEKQVSKDE
jgi:hypothetical protein